VPNSQCCKDRDCLAPTNAICVAGTCECPAGHTNCAGACIPDDQCCTSADCTAIADQVCQAGACVCKTGYKVCANECIAEASTCVTPPDAGTPDAEPTADGRVPLADAASGPAQSYDVGGCGCAHVEASIALLGLVALGGLARRRSRDRR